MGPQTFLSVTMHFAYPHTALGRRSHWFGLVGRCCWFPLRPWPQEPLGFIEDWGLASGSWIVISGLLGNPPERIPSLLKWSVGAPWKKSQLIWQIGSLPMEDNSISSSGVISLLLEASADLFRALAWFLNFMEYLCLILFWDSRIAS